ncbi:hypothetical protein D0Z07_1178 [Hyphodiscus hymeniophilus]|uniref:GST N-terminal domain-containing protein n=1 Tax=Hyphodiscus hymeniophilus TaxID=353542 RepID=A0A9P7AZU3_9HELO|nr:hypothetical protein D0Z07_1178 [Hyphodiscus hymeniophilus]
MANEIILFHYSYSPYARRVVWYLNLRGIAYTQCVDPPFIHRSNPTTNPPPPRHSSTRHSLQTNPHPLNRTGHIQRHPPHPLQTRVPLPLLALPPLHLLPDQRGYERLLESWAVDSGVFMRASQLIPTDTPLLKDARFQKDREDFSGRSWDPEKVQMMRPEALIEIKGAFEMLETALLADGREWILETQGPSLADIEAVWPFHWLRGLKGALPESVISGTQFPKAFAWIERFQQAASAAASRAGKAKTVKGAEALRIIDDAGFAEVEGEVDASDPTGLKKGEVVEIWPIDSGFNSRDRGPLVVLNGKEIVVEGKTRSGKEVRIHTPRHGFRVRRVGKSKL